MSGFTVSTAALKGALAVPFLEWPRRGSTIPILQYLKFEVSGGKGTISITDMESWRVGYLVLGEEFQDVEECFTVPFAEFKEIMGALGDEEAISFKNENGAVVVTFDSCVYRLPTLPVDDYPKYVGRVPQASIVVKSKDFTKAFGKFAFAADVTQNIYLHHKTVHFEYGGDTLRIATLDGMRLARLGIPIVESFGCNNESAWNLHIDAMKMVVGMPLGEEVKFDFCERHLRVECESGHFVYPYRGDENSKYPNLDTLIPKPQSFVMTSAIDADEVSRIISRAKITAKNKLKAIIVRGKGDGVATVRSCTEDVGDFCGVFSVDEGKPFEFAVNCAYFQELLGNVLKGEKLTLYASKSRILFSAENWPGDVWLLSCIQMKDVAVPASAMPEEGGIIPAKRRGTTGYVGKNFGKKD